MWIVYLIQHDLEKEIYIGLTNNLEKRLTKHNKGQSIATRRNNGKWILIYVEAYRSKEDAIQREQRLKQHGNAKRELKKRIGKSFL